MKLLEAWETTPKPRPPGPWLPGKQRAFREEGRDKGKRKGEEEREREERERDVPVCRI